MDNCINCGLPSYDLANVFSYAITPGYALDPKTFGSLPIIFLAHQPQAIDNTACAIVYGYPVHQPADGQYSAIELTTVHLISD